MSDYIYKNRISGRNNNTSYENYLCQLQNDFGVNGNCAQGNVFGQYEEERNVQQREMFGQYYQQNEEGVLTDNIDAVYEGELERLSSRLIQLLSNTRQRALQNAASPDLAFLRNDEKAGTNPIPGVSERRLSAETPVQPLSDTPVERERQRKHARNKHEKRRRSSITDSITELGYLLQDDDTRASCWPKGTILKKSVDYIKRLKDQSAVQRLEDQMREISMEIKTVTRRLERVEYSSNISSPYQNQFETTYIEPNINRCMIKSPVTCQERSMFYSDQPLNESRANVIQAPSMSTLLSSHGVWDGSSSTRLPDILMSLPSSSGKDTEDMNCLI